MFTNRKPRHASHQPSISRKRTDPSLTGQPCKRAWCRLPCQKRAPPPTHTPLLKYSNSSDTISFLCLLTPRPRWTFFLCVRLRRLQLYLRGSFPCHNLLFYRPPSYAGKFSDHGRGSAYGLVPSYLTMSWRPQLLQRKGKNKSPNTELALRLLHGQKTTSFHIKQQTLQKRKRTA